MIFVTVGTHEQQFDRLIKEIDDLRKRHIIDEETIVQTGYSNYEPQYCTWQKLFPYEDMIKNVENARIVITHGGPSSFIMPLQVGKVPIVVPRRLDFGEHVNNHQVNFAHSVSDRYHNIIVVEDISDLGRVITDYDSIVSDMTAGISSNNEEFCKKFEKIVGEIF